jgi:hypothetical protein
MAKSKYSPELTEIICNAIATYGTDEAGWEAGEISKPTFYSWQNTYADFQDAVGVAKKEYRTSTKPSLKRLGNRALLDYLQGNMVKVAHVRKEVVSPTGEIIELEEHRTTPVGVPQWAVERALGADLTEIEALERLAEGGMIPTWVLDCANKIFDEARRQVKTLLCGAIPEPIAYQLNQEREATGGLSEDTYNAIRQQVMGINAESVAPLPTAISGEYVPSADHSQV